MLPGLTQFRLELQANGIAHLVFDCPGRTMNVFSEAAIADLQAVAAWLPDADVAGLLVRSGKPNAFCAGADLTELGVAYDMIMAAPERARFDVAFDHFFRLGKAMRALEVSGKPVAAAIGGLALGGGCELALAAHHRVLADDPGVFLGLPESLVGLLPGSGGTQRLTRLIGIETALPILLEGARIAGRDALDAGAVQELVALGDEVAAAEAWLLANPDPIQPWDRDDWTPLPAGEVAAAIAPIRERVLAETLGHYPAPLAILDCVEQGTPQLFDGAIRTEMAIFSHLIQRAEARDLIQTQFLAKTEYDRLARRDQLPTWLDQAVAAARAALEDAGGEAAAAQAGFKGSTAAPLRERTRRGYWLDTAAPGAAEARALIERIAAAVVPVGEGRTADERRLIDYAVVKETGFPAYLGGPLQFAERG